MTDEVAAEIDLLGSEIACAAKQFVFDVSPAFVAHHSLRSYLFERWAGSSCAAAAISCHRNVERGT